MQRFRAHEYGVELTDGLDIVRIGEAFDGQLAISRKKSQIESSTTPGLVIVEKNNVAELGMWLSQYTGTTEEPSENDQEFHYLNEPYRRLAAVAINSVILEAMSAFDLDDLPDDTPVAEALAIISSRRHLENRNLDDQIRQSGLVLPESLVPLLFAEHTSDHLKLFPQAWTHFSSESAHQLGSWMLEGMQTLKKKSIWDNT